MKLLSTRVTVKTIVGLLCVSYLATLVLPFSVNGEFLAYNDCVFDPCLVAYGTDPCGNSVHYGDLNHITNFGTGVQASDHQSPYLPPASGLLKDYTTGASTGVTATLTRHGDVVWQPLVDGVTWSGGYDTAPGTDAYNTFHGIADMTGVIYYANAAGWWVDVNFTGLDPNKTYTFATSASRAKDRTDGAPGYTNRWSIYTISGIETATNSSTPGTTEYQGSPYKVRFNTGNNHYDGFVARWTSIAPGADGSFKVRAEADPVSESGYKAYAFDVFMLHEELYVDVPDVVGMTEAAAGSDITGAGLVTGTITYVCSDTVTAGLVISQDPVGGISVLAGSVVNLTVSTGQPFVPDVTGITVADAIAAINAIDDISYGSSTAQCSDTVYVGNVINQSVVGTAACGTIVDLVVSSGQPSVPDVTAMTESAAISAINAEPDISYGSSTTQCSDTVPAGDVISQSAVGTVVCGTVINLVVSTGQPIVPDVIGMAKWDAIALLNSTENISYGNPIYICSQTVPAGHVITQDPLTGPAPCGTAVDLIVAQVAPTVPNVVGMTEAGAINAITSVMFLSMGDITYEYDNAVPVGMVISQNPAPGPVSCDISTVDIVISLGRPVISGYITEPDTITPVAEVLVDANNGGGLGITDVNGYYEITVDCNWSGTITPSKVGYIFEPEIIVDSNVNTNMENNNYIATMNVLVISGYAVDTGLLPLAGVLMSPDGNGGPFTTKYYGGGTALTDISGYYGVVVDYNWSGNIVPSRYTYTFEPGNAAYTNVTENITESQDFIGKQLTYRITGHIKNACDMPIAGVFVDANNLSISDTSDANGFYEVWVDVNWSGTVTPSKPYRTFEPAFQAYTDVLEDRASQDYVAANIYDLDCDGYINYGDIEIISENWLMSGPNVPGNFYDDEDILNFLDWSIFAAAWGF